MRNEGENKYDGKYWEAHRQENPDKSLELRGSSDPRRVLHARRDRIEIAFDHPDVARDAPEIDDDQRGLSIQTEPADILACKIKKGVDRNQRKHHRKHLENEQATQNA